MTIFKHKSGSPAVIIEQSPASHSYKCFVTFVVDGFAMTNSDQDPVLIALHYAGKEIKRLRSARRRKSNLSKFVEERY